MVQIFHFSETPKRSEIYAALVIVIATILGVVYALIRDVRSDLHLVIDERTTSIEDVAKVKVNAVEGKVATLNGRLNALETGLIHALPREPHDEP